MPHLSPDLGHDREEHRACWLREMSCLKPCPYLHQMMLRTDSTQFIKTCFIPGAKNKQGLPPGLSQLLYQMRMSYLYPDGAANQLASAPHKGTLAVTSRGRQGLLNRHRGVWGCSRHVDGHLGTTHHARPWLPSPAGLLADDAHAAVAMTLLPQTI